VRLAALVAALSIPIDVDRLYTCDDPSYLIWVRAVVQEATRVQNEINAQQ
jgi:hypothetical protein